MQKKLALKKADEYDYRVATLYAVKAVIAYMDGFEKCQRIGNEQGDVEEWDDIVLHGVENSAIHCQVKRQTTNFSNDDPIRGVKTSGKNRGEPKDLSALDSAFEKLAQYFEKPVSERGTSKKFRLAVPGANIQIKKKLTLINLHSVCTEWRKAGANVNSFSNAGVPTETVRNWLTSWCGFTTADSMFECLRAVEIIELGAEDRLDEDCRESLAVWYSSPEIVRLEVRDFLVQNASSEQSITPRMIASHIDRYVRSEKRAWARYSMPDPLNWEISGTLSGHGIDVEFPYAVVNRLWKPIENRNYELQFGHRCGVIHSSSLQLALVRLALHVEHGTTVSAYGAEGWNSMVAQYVRMTLGNSDEDLSNLRWSNGVSIPVTADHRKLHTTSLVEQEALELNSHMNAITWDRVKYRVNSKLAQGHPNEVRDVVESIWCEWKCEIDADPDLQQKLVAGMLYAKCEGNRSIGSLRSGLRTVRLIADAVEMLLHLAVAYEATGRSWGCFSDGDAVRTVALMYWAGPDQQIEYLRRFFDDDGVAERAEFLGKETAQVLVLPQARSSVSAIFGRTLADGSNGGDSFAESRKPTCVLTQSQEYQDMLRQKTIASLKDFFSKTLQGREEQRTQHINNLTAEDTHAN